MSTINARLDGWEAFEARMDEFSNQRKTILARLAALFPQSTDSHLTAMDERLELLDRGLGYWDGRFDERLLFLAALEHRELMVVFGQPPVRQNAELMKCLLPTTGAPAQDNVVSQLRSLAIHGPRLFPPSGSAFPFFSGKCPRTWVRYCEAWFSENPMADHEKVVMAKANFGLSAWFWGWSYGRLVVLWRELAEAVCSHFFDSDEFVEYDGAPLAHAELEMDEADAYDEFDDLYHAVNIGEDCLYLDFMSVSPLVFPNRFSYLGSLDKLDRNDYPVGDGYSMVARNIHFPDVAVVKRRITIVFNLALRALSSNGIGLEFTVGRSEVPVDSGHYIVCVDSFGIVLPHVSGSNPDFCEAYKAAFPNSQLTTANARNGTMVAPPFPFVLAEDGEDLSAADNVKLEDQKAASLLGIADTYIKLFDPGGAGLPSDFIATGSPRKLYISCDFEVDDNYCYAVVSKGRGDCPNFKGPYKDILASQAVLSDRFSWVSIEALDFNGCSGSNLRVGDAFLGILAVKGSRISSENDTSAIALVQVLDRLAIDFITCLADVDVEFVAVRRECCHSGVGYGFTSELVGCSGELGHRSWTHGYKIFPTYYGVSVHHSVGGCSSSSKQQQ
ncbi:unnamed protein product [Linum trigynum]|uniref:Uncharacterized protein n=1 Tax=Linum trigynum TaxID=586398 RepID=A0AAV2F8L0_9ROSI